MKLENYRKTKGLSYEELADFLGLRKSTTFNICKEKINCVSLPTAHQIVEKTEGLVDFPELIWGDC